MEDQRVVVYPGADTPRGLVEYDSAVPHFVCDLPDEANLSVWVMHRPSGTVLRLCHQTGLILGNEVVILGRGAIRLASSMTSTIGARQS